MTPEQIQLFINAAGSPAAIALASSPVALKVLEWLRDDIGLRQKPGRTLSEGKAQAYADMEGQLIKQSYNSEVTEDERLLARSLLVRIETDKREQRNKESVVFKALAALQALKPDAKPEDVKTEEVDEDWRAIFFDKCRLVSDEEMQMLWGKVLAGEVNQPGTFSRRLLNLLSTTSESEARVFTTLCKYSVVVDNNTATIPLIYSNKEGESGLEDFSLLHGRHLENMGLTLDLRSNLSFEIYGESVHFSYHGTSLWVECPNDWNKASISGLLW